MPQQHVHDDPYVLGPVLDARLDLLKEWIDQRFADVRGDIARVEDQTSSIGSIKQQLAAHHRRILAQERQSVWRWAATVLSAFLALLGIRSPS